MEIITKEFAKTIYLQSYLEDCAERNLEPLPFGIWWQNLLDINKQAYINDLNDGQAVRSHYSVYIDACREVKLKPLSFEQWWQDLL